MQGVKFGSEQVVHLPQTVFIRSQTTSTECAHCQQNRHFSRTSTWALVFIQKVGSVFRNTGQCRVTNIGTLSV